MVGTDSQKHFYTAFVLCEISQEEYFTGAAFCSVLAFIVLPGAPIYEQFM